MDQTQRTLTFYETLAQSVEHLTFNERVDGSSPSSLNFLLSGYVNKHNPPRLFILQAFSWTHISIVHVSLPLHWRWSGSRMARFCAYQVSDLAIPESGSVDSLRLLLLEHLLLQIAFHLLKEKLKGSWRCK